MAPPKLYTFEKVLDVIGSKKKSLLLGNGFSIDIHRKFNYKTLLKESDIADDSAIKKVFQSFGVDDFEYVIASLENASKVAKAYDKPKLSETLQNDALAVRDHLIKVIRNLHPKIQFDIPERNRQACADFIGNFSQVFTLNYDVLLYWVHMLLKRSDYKDGFREEYSSKFRAYDPGVDLNVYYLHGGLHIFKDKTRNALKRLNTGQTLINDIADTIGNTKRLPLFVAEGKSVDKLNKIRSVPYLNDCYEALLNQKNVLFIFGHSADDKDEHIYDAIFSGNTKAVVFCVYDPDRNFRSIREKLAKYKERDPDKPVFYVNASKMDIWGQQVEEDEE